MRLKNAENNRELDETSSEVSKLKIENSILKRKVDLMAKQIRNRDERIQNLEIGKLSGNINVKNN